MKPRGLNSLLSKQNSNLSPAKPVQTSVNLDALGAAGQSGEKHEQGKNSHTKPTRGAKGSTAAKRAASTLRRTAPGA